MSIIKSNPLPFNGIPSDTSDQNDSLAIGSEAWNKLTARRAKLIYKKNRQGLSDEENAEYERLQEISQKAIAKAFPASRLTTEERRIVLEAIESASNS